MNKFALGIPIAILSMDLSFFLFRRAFKQCFLLITRTGYSKPLPSDQSRITEQAKFTYALGKAFKKQIKTIEDQGEKQIKALEDYGKETVKYSDENDF